MGRTGEVPIDRVDVSVFRIPTEEPESDGTLSWDHTTMVLVEPSAGGKKGIGYTYADTATAALIRETLAPRLAGHDAFATAAAFRSMVTSVRNLGRPGISAMAISAVDNALWDLRSKLLGAPLVRVLGAAREEAKAYGSGGFTSYTIEELQAQLGGWASAGMEMVKMKVGRDAGADPARAKAAREAIGEEVQLFVDANGGYGTKQAIGMAEVFHDLGVTWFEEPVPADDLAGLRYLRDRCPGNMDVAAGEYGYEIGYFRRMAKAGAVDVLQADITRCGGVTGMLRVAAICEAFRLPLSTHCAPSQHVHPACAIEALRHVEYFHDHVRIEGMLLDGAAKAERGVLRPDLGREGMGIALKRADAERWRV